MTPVTVDIFEHENFATSLNMKTSQNIIFVEHSIQKERNEEDLAQHSITIINESKGKETFILVQETKYSN